MWRTRGLAWIGLLTGRLFALPCGSVSVSAKLPSMEALPAVIDVTDASFETEVLDASHERPIVVDFWAPWCGPCRTLGPLLEQLARESEGAFRLAKVDIDQNPAIAQSLAIQSIPFVLAFRDGQVVSEFVGAQPEAVVRQFLERILPDEADGLAQEGSVLAGEGRGAEAEACFRRALDLRARHPRASLGLAHLLAASSREQEAETLLQTIVADGEIGVEVERLAAQLRMRASGGDEDALRRGLEETPEVLATRLALGRLLAAGASHEEALEVFLEIVRRDRDYEDAAARKAMLDIFTLLGRDDPLVDAYQRRLSQILFA